VRWTAQEHLKIAADSERAATRPGLSQEQREAYLLKAHRFGYLAELAKQSRQAGSNRPRGLSSEWDPEIGRALWCST